MEIEILKEFDNLLIGRKEYTVKIVHEGAATPKRTELRSSLAAHVNTDAEKTVLIGINSHFGIAHTTVLFHVYEDLEQLKRTEHSYILKRNAIID
ncbi:MAG: 30S ribosomal protein S24e [Candidatus Hodarchaeales archaeon]